MNEKQQLQFQKTFSLLLIICILLVNLNVHVTQLKYSFLLFLGNIMFFTMEGTNWKEKMLHVFFGGAVGLLLGYGLEKFVPLLVTRGVPVLVALLGCLFIVLFLLIYLHPKAPMFLNNVGFLYLIAGTALGETLLSDFPSIFATFAIGNTLMNLISWGIMILSVKVITRKEQ